MIQSIRNKGENMEKMMGKRGIWILLVVLVLSDLLTWIDWEAEIPFSVTVSFLFIGVYTLFCLKKWITWRQELVLNGLFGLIVIILFIIRHLYHVSDLFSAFAFLLGSIFFPITVAASFLAKKGTWLQLLLIVWFFALSVFRLVEEHSKK